jgi:hypothetical protein
MSFSRLAHAAVARVSCACEWPARRGVREADFGRVMAGPVPAIHATPLRSDKSRSTARFPRTPSARRGVDARDERGHDRLGSQRSVKGITPLTCSCSFREPLC